MERTKSGDDLASGEHRFSLKLAAAFADAPGANAAFLAVAERLCGLPGRTERPVVSLEPDASGGVVAALAAGGAYRFPDCGALRAGMEALARGMSLTAWERGRFEAGLADLRDRELARDLRFGRELAADAREAVSRGDLSFS